MLPKKIIADFLELQTYQPNHSLELVNLINSNVVHLSKFLAWAREYPKNEKAQLEFIEKRIVDFENKTDFVYGIFKNNVLIGGIGAHSRVGENTLEIGYWMSENNSGKGFMTLATKALLNTIFKNTSYHKIIIIHHIENIASRKIPEKLGFEQVPFSELIESRQISILSDTRSEEQTVVWKINKSEATI